MPTNPPTWLSEWVRVIAPFTSLLFSGLLVYLYYRQQSLLEIERRPVIEIGNYEIKNDSIDIAISNYGHGIAQDLELAVAIDFPKTEELAPGVQSVSLRRVEEDGEWGREQTIRPHQERIKFRAKPVMSLEGKMASNASGFGFYSGTELMRRAGINEFQFQLFVRFSNQLDEKESKPVFGFLRDVDLDKEMSFEEAYADGGLISSDVIDTKLEDEF